MKHLLVFIWIIIFIFVASAICAFSALYHLSIKKGDRTAEWLGDNIGLPVTKFIVDN